MAPQDNPTYTRSTPKPCVQDLAAGSAPSLPAAPQHASPASNRLLKEPVEKAVKVDGTTDAPKKHGTWSTIVDAVEGGLGVLSTITDFIPAPAGSIVKLMAGTGLTIIEMLKVRRVTK